MLLVMNTTGLFEPNQPLTVLTKDRIDTFLAGLWEEVFKISPPSPTTEVRQSSIGDSPMLVFFLDEYFLSAEHGSTYSTQ